MIYLFQSEENKNGDWHRELEEKEREKGEREKREEEGKRERLIFQLLSHTSNDYSIRD